MKLIKYKNATKVKLYNRSVTVHQLENDFVIGLKTISDDLSPRASHIIDKWIVVKTGIKLTKEASLSLFVCLGIELEKLGIINFTDENKNLQNLQK